MLARFERDSLRKSWKAFVFCCVVDCLRWARKDSRPLLKANEPRGRAESERSRRAWSEAMAEGWCGSGQMIGQSYGSDMY